MEKNALKQRIITYIGWLGFTNLGDEAFYDVNKRLFSKYRLVPSGHWSSQKQYSKITLFGGGSLLPVWTWLIKPNRYNYALGVGVRDPKFWGLHSAHFRQIRSFNFRYIGVRDHRSKEMLDSWKIHSVVTGDPCLLLQPTGYAKREGMKVAVNVGSENLIWGGNRERLLVEMSRVCKTLKENGYRPILIPFEESNLPNIERVSKEADVEVFSGWTNVPKVLDLMATCQVTISEKLHPTVFSAVANTPFISIEFEPKCRDFAESVGFGDYVIRTDKLVADKVIVKFNNLLNNWSEMQRILLTNVSRYRRRLKIFADCIAKDIESLPDSKWTPSALESIKWYMAKPKRRRLSILHGPIR